MREKNLLLGEIFMNYIIVVFKARTETLSFANILRGYNVPFQIINTPRNLNLSCGISVKMPAFRRDIAEEILRKRNFQSFAGIF